MNDIGNHITTRVINTSYKSILIFLIIITIIIIIRKKWFFWNVKNLAGYGNNFAWTKICRNLKYDEKCCKKF